MQVWGTGKAISLKNKQTPKHPPPPPSNHRHTMGYDTEANATHLLVAYPEGVPQRARREGRSF